MAASTQVSGEFLKLVPPVDGGTGCEVEWQRSEAGGVPPDESDGAPHRRPTVSRARKRMKTLEPESEAQALPEPIGSPQRVFAEELSKLALSIARDVYRGGDYEPPAWWAIDHVLKKWRKNPADVRKETLGGYLMRILVSMRNKEGGRTDSKQARDLLYAVEDGVFGLDDDGLAVALARDTADTGLLKDERDRVVDVTIALMDPPLPMMMNLLLFGDEMSNELLGAVCGIPTGSVDYFIKRGAAELERVMSKYDTTGRLPKRIAAEVHRREEEEDT